MQQRFLIKILKNQLRLRLCVGGSEIRYVWVLLTVLSEKSTFEDILVPLLIRRFISVGYQYVTVTLLPGTKFDYKPIDLNIKKVLKL